MLELLKFVFSDFWIYVGMMFLLPIIGVSVAMPIAALSEGFGMFGSSKNEKKENE